MGLLRAPGAHHRGRVTWPLTALAHDWKLQPGTLEAHCAANPGLPPLLILDHPNNPTSVSCGKAELAAAQAGETKDEAFIQRRCLRMLAAMERIADWLS